MKCIQCGTTMTVKRENAPYKALPGTVLVGVEVHRCPRCGEYEVAIPAIDELDRVLARAVIESEYRLTGGEVRFLRSYLGYSGADFAKLIGTTPATVSRWENDVQPIGQSSDRLLRTLVLLEKRVDTYPISKLAEIRDERPGKIRARRFTPSAKKWKPADARA